MKFLLDHCVPRSVAQQLIGAGHEAIRLVEVMRVDAADPEVLAKADSLDAVLISLNGDFADITAYPPSNHQGIISLQLRNRPELIDLLIASLVRYLADHPSRDDLRRTLLVVEQHRVRSRH